MVQVSGTLILFTKQYIRDIHGQEKLDAVLNDTEENTKKVVSGSIFSNQMYEVKIYQDFLRAFDRVLGRAELKKVADYNMKKQLSGLYGIILKFAKVENLMSRSDELWKKNYSEGNVKVVSEDGKKFVMTVSNFEFNDAQMYGFMYYIESFLEIVTKKKLVSIAKRIDNKTTELTYTLLV